MTTRREVPFASDTSAWVHTEIGEMKSRLSVVQQAVEQSRALATDAAEAAHQARNRIDIMETQAAAIEHLQDDLHSVREQLVRAQDDIHSLRQSREEIERRDAGDAERDRQERNDAGRRFADIEQAIGTWQERIGGVEEYNRRALEAVAQVTMRLESMENELGDSGTMQSRAATTLSRIDQEMKLLTGTVAGLQREDETLRERASTALEMLRRLENEVEALKAESVRLLRMDDRLELVQAERTRHNERINDITAELALVDHALNDQSERIALSEARSNSTQEDMRKLRERLVLDREQLAAYLQGLRDLEADMRKRQIVAIEKEMRDIRSRALNVAEE
jgi:chromosome segregation ATPase